MSKNYLLLADGSQLLTKYNKETLHMCVRVNVSNVFQVCTFSSEFPSLLLFKRPSRKTENSDTFIEPLWLSILSYQTSLYIDTFVVLTPSRFLLHIVRFRRLKEIYQLFFCYGSEVFPHLGLSPNGLSLPSDGVGHETLPLEMLLLCFPENCHCRWRRGSVRPWTQEALWWNGSDSGEFSVGYLS